MTDYRQEAALQAARAQLHENYSYNRAMEAYNYPSEQEREFAMMELKLLGLKQAGNTIDAVIRKLEKSSKPNLFAKHYQALRG